MKKIDLVKLTVCGPCDVDKEVQIAHEVVNDWNLQNGEARGFWVKHQHWSTDSHPETGDRPQAILNRQIIDDADIVVAILWMRLGTPTGQADSGTEEEIRRATALGRKVVVYFSDLEAPTAPTDPSQYRLLKEFRRKFIENKMGLYSSFSSREKFRSDFTRHLAQVLNEFQPKRKKSNHKETQSIHGDNNIQVGGNLNFYNNPPKQKKVFARPDGAVSPAEELQIKAWIEELAGATTGPSQSEAFKMWWMRFKNKFKVAKYEELPSAEMVNAAAWFKQQRAIQKRGLKTKLPEEWRKERYTAIHAVMGKMGLDKDAYYHEISLRLRLKKPFTSLTELTKTDLERVYVIVMRDAQR